MGWKTRIELALGEPQSPVLTITPLPPNGTPSGIWTHILRFRRPSCFPLHHRRIWNVQRDLNSYPEFRRFLCFPLHHERILRPPASPHWCAPSTVITTPYASQIILHSRAGGIEGNWTLITSMANWSTRHCTTTPYGGSPGTWTPISLIKSQV